MIKFVITHCVVNVCLHKQYYQVHGFNSLEIYTVFVGLYFSSGYSSIDSDQWY